MKRNRSAIHPVAGAITFAVLALATGTRAGAASSLSYIRDIRPILSDNCFYCHGPDKNHRDGKFRLDVRDSAVAKKAIVPGKPDASKLIERIFTSDSDDLMPPPKSHKKLSASQKDILKRWIAEGAVYEPHWAYIVPSRPPVPKVEDQAWVRTPIDAFIRQALEQSHLAPSQQADKPTLLRRLSLDLIGLPPTRADLQAFVDDNSPDAYQKQIDRLMASPHYGERMAVPWLDSVRFADTVGFHGDQNQNDFPYRDYVIDSFNRNKPFDQFTIEQLAGDLLPNPTPEQLTATCFNRLNMMTREGGAQAGEYLAKYAADRVRTVSSAWLGSTMNCCECHDHKFDPFTTRDFYSMEAFWADVKQWGVYTDYAYTPNPDLKGFTNDYPFPPEIVVDSPYLQHRQSALLSQIDQIAADYSTKHQPGFEQWRKTTSNFLANNPTGWSTVKAQGTADNGSLLLPPKAGATARIGFALPACRVAAIRLEALPTEIFGGSILNGAKIKGKVAGIVDVSVSIKSGGRERKLPVFFADADHKDERYSNGHAILGLQGGWKTTVGKLNEPQSAVYLLSAPIEAADGDTLVVTLNKNVLGCIRISVSPIASIRPIDTAFLPALQRALAKSPPDDLVLARTYLLSEAADEGILEHLRTLQTEFYECREGKSPVMVTQAVTPREMRILRRGNWQDTGGDIVQPETPRFLSKVSDPSDHKLTRLDLARWLVSADNPLTSRAVVNRVWKQFFGTGLCASVDDLGAQGELPSNPELLDWLAVEFRESGWDVKHMVKLIVMSSTYRQDSNPRPEVRDADPQNRLLASQSPRRLEAEFVRDNALAIAGLINLDIGGPSVFPYQPEGYYANIQFPSRTYVADEDDRQYRRGIYMHWQRTFLHPMLANFDAPSREDAICTRTISNTPQQALTLLNDPTFVEAARVLAEHAMAAGASEESRFTFIFKQALSRSPRTNEQQSLGTFLAGQRSYYEQHKDDAGKLVHTGIAPVAAGIDESELAAWTTVCRVVLNLHESITRY